MKGYIDISDERSKWLKIYFEKNGDEIVDKCCDDLDFYYLGKDGKKYKNVQISSKNIFTLIQNDEMDTIPLNHHQDFREENNVLTTLALIKRLIDDQHIYQKRILILGYGNLGQKIAQALACFQNEIAIANRDDKHKKDIQEKGYQHYDLNNLHDYFDVIINTIPFEIIDYHLFTQCLIYDLATTVQKEQNYYSLRSLPNSYFPQEAGYLLFKTMDKVIKNVKK